MDPSIIHWPVIQIFDSSLQAFDHTTTPSFFQQSSMDYPVAYMMDEFSQVDSFRSSEDSLDESWTCAGPYDDDEENDLKEETKS